MSVVVELHTESSSFRLPLVEISGNENTASTECILTRRDNKLAVQVLAADPNMMDLVATATAPNSDRFLYEEDCVQLAITTAAGIEVLLVNAQGSRKGNTEWPVATRRAAAVWEITVMVPTDGDAVGLSVHRFFRGVGNECHGINDGLPHPLDPLKFLPVSLAPGADAQALIESVAEEQEAATRRTVEQTRQLIARARTQGGVDASLATAIEFARRRDEQGVTPDERSLCWNEGHHQQALLDLWELTHDREWLQRAIPRIERVWACRADRLSIKDSFWGEALPTWYNNTETGTACTLTSGVIIAPIARLSRAANDNATTADIVNTAWIDQCHETIALHDREWIDFADGSGTYFEPYPKGPRRMYPKGGSRICPLNRAFFMAFPLLDLAAIQERPEYQRKAKAMALFFKNNTELQENGSLVWEYEPSSYPSMGEDFGHASCQILFAEQCTAEGIVFTESDLRAMAQTLAQNVFCYGDVPAGHIRLPGLPGLHYGVASWASLCRFVPDVFPKMIDLIQTALRMEDDPHTLGGWGVRCLTRLEIGRRLVEESS